MIKWYGNDAGWMIDKIWHEIPNDFENVDLNKFVIMPNHIHGIIEINPVGADSISARSTDLKRAEMDSAPTVDSISAHDQMVW